MPAEARRKLADAVATFIAYLDVLVPPEGLQQELHVYLWNRCERMISTTESLTDFTELDRWVDDFHGPCPSILEMPGLDEATLVALRGVCDAATGLVGATAGDGNDVVNGHFDSHGFYVYDDDEPRLEDPCGLLMPGEEEGR